MSSPTTSDAFRLLGVPPDADAATIRAAWRALVRRYHPDQVLQDKAAANRRLAELNAAYDLVSAWQPDMAASNPDRSPRPSRNRRARRTEAGRRANAAQRRAEEAAARERAEALDRAEAAKRAARKPAPKPAPRPAPTPDRRAACNARERFLAALRILDATTPGRCLGFA